MGSTRRERNDWWMIPGPGEFLLTLVLVFLAPFYIIHVASKHPKGIAAAILIFFRSYFLFIYKTFVALTGVNLALSTLVLPLVGINAIIQGTAIAPSTVLIILGPICGLITYLLVKHLRRIWGPPIIPRFLFAETDA